MICCLCAETQTVQSWPLTPAAHRVWYHQLALTSEGGGWHWGVKFHPAYLSGELASVTGQGELGVIGDHIRLPVQFLLVDLLSELLKASGFRGPRPQQFSEPGLSVGGWGEAIQLPSVWSLTGVIWALYFMKMYMNRPIQVIYRRLQLEASVPIISGILSWAPGHTGHKHLLNSQPDRFNLPPNHFLI